MQYPELRYIPEAEDPSLTLETNDLVVKVIDNTGMLAPPAESKAYFNKSHRFTTFTHHLGYHGIRTLILMFSDPKVRFYVVSGGGHLFFSPVQNPAWDFEWIAEDYPLGQPIGFDGRLIYTRFVSEEDVERRHREWIQSRDADSRR